MTMEINELTEVEDLALVSLLKVIIRADHQLSGQEHAETRRIAQLMGVQRFAERVAEAQQRFSSLAEIKAHVEAIERPSARALIYEILFGLAGEDGVSPEEEEILTWLRSVWALEA